MDLSRVITVFALILQLANVITFFVGQYAPEYAVLVAGILAAIQAFTKAVTPEPKAKR